MAQGDRQPARRSLRELLEEDASFDGSEESGGPSAATPTASEPNGTPMANTTVPILMSPQTTMTSTPNPLATAVTQQSLTSATGSPASKPAESILQWTIQETEQWLSEFKGVPGSAVKTLQAHGTDGQLLVEICRAGDATEVLQFAGVDNPIVRRLLISSVMRKVSQPEEGTPSAAAQAPTPTRPPARSPQVLGEKSITMPTLPAPTHNRELPTSEQWNLFSNAARMWGDDTSELYARAVAKLYVPRG